MDGRKTCKDCRAVVVNPIECDRCNIAAHPSCISRTNYPALNGKFVDCAVSPSVDILASIQAMIQLEFAKVREEIKEMYRSDLESIRADIQQLSDRIDQIQVKAEDSTHLALLSSSFSEEDFIEELVDRERRSYNLIFYNLDEPIVNQENARNDNDLARDILNSLIPCTANVTTLRLGKKQHGIARPLRITLRSKQDVITALRNKTKYTGPVKIYQDQTPKQRKYLKNLQIHLKELKEAGDQSKTIRYINGIPRIVQASQGSKSKN